MRSSDRKERALRAYKLARIIDEGDDQDLLFVLLFSGKQQRRVKWMHRRIDWNYHIEMLRETGKFQSRYHMKEPTFNYLVQNLRCKITCNEVQSIRSTRGNDPITPEMTVGAGLRFLGGSLVKDIADLYGMSDSSVHRIVGLFLFAVNMHEEFKIDVPRTPPELRSTAAAFQSISGAFEIYDGCVGAIDGWLCCINAPRGVSSQAEYHSGHYHRYGLNIQAVCDSQLRFIYFSVAAKGRTNDVRAFSRCLALRNWLKSLPPDYFIIGDNAYTLSDRILIPFRGNQKKDPHKRTYNYYLCQLRIRIEMAFGRLSTKWRIFRRNLECSLEQVSNICNAAARLHNFIIDHEEICFSNSYDNDNFQVERFPGSGEFNRGYLPSLRTRKEAEAKDREEFNDKGSTQLRDRILLAIEERGMTRPTHNLDRNRELDEDSVFEKEPAVAGAEQEHIPLPTEIVIATI